MAESVLVDQSQMNQSRASSLATGNDVADSGGVFMMRSRNMSLNSYSSFVVVGGGGGTGFMPYGSSSSYHLHKQQPPTPSVYGSLPASSSFYSAQKLAHQPPLLPLPSANKPPGLASSSPRLTRTNTGVNGALRLKEHKATKPKPFLNSVPRKAAAAGSHTLEHQKAAEIKSVIAPGKDEGAELVRMESIYSLSPPPSNLPLPTFLLARHKAAAAACKDQAVMEGGGAAGDY